MVDLRAAAYRAERDSIYFLVGVERITGEFNADVAVNAGIVGLHVASVDSCRTAFNLLCALIVEAFAADYQSAPVAGTPLTRRLGRSHNDRLLRRSFHLAPAARLDDERSHGFLFPFNDGSSRYAEPCAFIHVDPTFEKIRSLFKRHVARKVEILGSVAQFVAVEHESVAVCHVPFVGHFGVLFLRFGFIIV